MQARAYWGMKHWTLTARRTASSVVERPGDANGTVEFNSPVHYIAT